MARKLKRASIADVKRQLQIDPLRRQAIERGDLIVARAGDDIGCVCPSCMAGKPTWWNQNTHEPSCDMPDLVQSPRERNSGMKRRNPSERISLTYGKLPSLTQMRPQWGMHVGDRDAIYTIKIGQGAKAREDDAEYDLDGEYTFDDLREKLQELISRFEQGDDNAGNWASSILETLGIEWV